MATNELGHKLAAMASDQLTLGAYRLGNRLPWAPGALIDLWAACPRGESATGVPAPHVLFKRTRGDHAVDRGSMYCPACRVELDALRASGQVVKAPPPPRFVPPPVTEAAAEQLLELPF